MCANWTALFAQMHGSLGRQSAEQHFRHMRRDFPEFGTQTSISDLLTKQSATSGDHEARFRVIRLLVIAAQSAAVYRTTAHIMVITALWPGLDAAYHRLWRKYHLGRADLASDLLAEISTGITCMDLTVVRAVAATLIRNVERDVGRALIDQERLGRVMRDIAEPSIESEATWAARPGPNRIDDIDARLAVLSQPDALLLKRIFIFGETQAQAGQALGLTPGAARKRFQRALVRLGPPKNISGAVSHFVRPLGL